MRPGIGPLVARAAALLVVCAAVLDCTGFLEPHYSPGIVPFQPPAAYAFWWQLTESCAGRTADLSKVKWYVVPGVDSVEASGEYAQGFWLSWNNSIVLAGRHVQDGLLVRHEMLHALVGAGHEREYFIDRCGGIVVCEDRCLRDAGGASVPPLSAPTIPESSLIVDARIDSATPSIWADSGWVTVVVSVRNPLPNPVWAVLSPIPGDTAASATFGTGYGCIASCTVGGAGGYDYVWGTRLGFGAGETKRYVDDVQLPPGTYILHAEFNGQPIIVDTVTVGP